VKWWLFATGLAACGLPEPTLLGEHVRIAADPGLVPCGDAVGHMDGFVAMLAEEWGIQAPSGDDRIDVFWLNPIDFTSRTICVNDRPCSVWGSVYSTSLPLDHELVHAVAREFGTPPPFFIEGLAVAYELPSPSGLGDYGGLSSSTTVLEAVTIREGAYLPSYLYPLAGAFTAFVIDRHGISKFLAVYKKLRFLDGRGRISRVFADVFGESLEDAVAAFEQVNPEGACSARAFRLKRFECGAPELVWDGVHLAEYRTLDCDQEDVLGPFASDELLFLRSLEIPEDGVYEVALFGDADAGSGGRWNRLEMARCGGCEDYVELAVFPDRSIRKRLPAGRYSLRFVGPAGEASGIGLRIDRLALVLDEDDP
jgi:hypothetical protein